MSRNTIFKVKNFLMLSVLLPVVSGCGGSGGGGALASLFGGSPSSSGTSGVVTGGGGIEGGLASLGGGGVPPALHNPEPVTLLLLGSGMVALGYLKRHKK